MSEEGKKLLRRIYLRLTEECVLAAEDESINMKQYASIMKARFDLAMLIK